jgi:hypothetical protein
VGLRATCHLDLAQNLSWRLADRVKVMFDYTQLLYCNIQKFYLFKIDELNLNELFCEHFNVGK